MYAQVIVDIAHSNVDRLFTYAIPEEMALQPGQRVLVPFGRRNKPVEGFIIALSSQPDGMGERVKSVVRALEPYPILLPEQLELAIWMQQSYHCLLIDALRLMLPSVVRTGRAHEKVIRTICLAPGLDTEQAKKSLLDRTGKPKAPRQWEVLQLLMKTGMEMPVEDVTGFLPGARSAIAALLEKGVLVEGGRVTFRSPRALHQDEVNSCVPEALTSEQETAVEAILQGMETGKGIFLLHGVTGSGKTEVYLRCIQTALSKGKGAIVLVPEIALTPQTVQRFRSRLGETVAVLHSRLSQGERFDEWRRVRLGKARVVIGARGAVFAPVEKLGFIVIDEEHEQSYQSEAIPRYHALEIAKKRCSLANAPLLLGSATPSVASYQRAVAGRYCLLELPRRVAGRPLPEIQVADMRQEFAAGNTGIFSGLLYQALGRCLASGKQAILFINRRGYSTFVSCRGCGYVFQCPHCDVSLTYHKLDRKLKCHYCGYEMPLPQVCPACGKAYIKYFGVGTQQVEEQLYRLFPGVKALRMDLDTTRQKDAHQTILSQFAAGEAQVLIGTQMIAKGLDFPNVTLVGVVAADATLHIPDYRSQERTFQLITQVAGRAGRDDIPGQVVVQTYSPEHPCICFAKAQDYKGFFAWEMAQRRACLFPPFGLFVRALFSGPEEEPLQAVGTAFAKGVEAAVRNALGDAGEELLYCCASPSPVKRKQGLYRYQVLLKLKRTQRTAGALQAIYDYASHHRGELFATLEINPGDML